MRALFWAELFKLCKQRRTYYALGAILVMEIIILFSAYYQGRSFIDLLLTNFKETFYFEGNLLNGNLLVYVILNTLWFHLPLLLMIIISGLLTAEYKDGTLQTVFLQPVHKLKFIACKYLAAILFTLVSVLFLMITAFGLSYLIFGQGDLIVYLDTFNFYEPHDAFHRLIWAFFSGSVTMVFYTVVSLTMAICFKDATITWIVAAFFLIVSSLLIRIDYGDSLFGKVLYAKLGESWQYFFHFEIPWQPIIINNGLLIVYSILVMALGMLIFTKNDIS
ncbi:ABC transporter permease [Muricauda sp. CAU 1633]|uniref:ABC transporter permease n=1 Tax=Allomuricauda sp. CAU 1633 TaxID=2816036 RepID=UPI001A9032AC|nr:ABC transporter permease [Muricauda sp. CAU 1633]MBO0322731.1 ABC transporter permease [Muricauda sp. CAU 1633]